MFSELFRIPYEWAGVPIFGLGVLLAIWALATVATLFGLVRRYGWSAETWSAVPMLLLIGAAIVMLPRLFPGGLPVRGYGIMLLAGIVAGAGMAIRRAKQGGLDPEIIITFALWLVICGVIGARLFYVVEYWDEKFAGKSVRDTLLEIVNVPQGGLVIYGGFFGAVVGFVILVRKHKLPLLAMADVAAPSMMIGLALGRIGCLLNGCCYGGQTDWPWGLTFPQDSPPYIDQAARGELHGFRLDSRDGNAAVVARVDTGSPAAVAGLREDDVVTAINGVPIKSIAQAEELLLKSFDPQQPLRLGLRPNRSVQILPAAPPARSRPVHPTQIYSAIDAALLSWLLWSYYPFRRRDGECIAILLTIHPVTRFLLEIIRTDEPEVFGTGLSISQNIGLVLLACAAFLWWYVLRQPRGVAWPLGVAPPSRGGHDVARRPSAGPFSATRQASSAKPARNRGHGPRL
jgi:phosphatidylglycerol:prolipoprotein diacylglycerol transferase